MKSWRLEKNNSKAKTPKNPPHSHKKSEMDSANSPKKPADYAQYKNLHKVSSKCAHARTHSATHASIHTRLAKYRKVSVSYAHIWTVNSKWNCPALYTSTCQKRSSWNTLRWIWRIRRKGTVWRESVWGAWKNNIKGSVGLCIMLER